VEDTSWSCMHGIDRWKEECGCTPDATWKAPLRAALDQTALWLDDIYLNALKPLFSDPWELRHRFIDVLLGKITLQELCTELASHDLNQAQLNLVQDLLSAQFERQRMFTSCGFFHAEFHRLEPQNNIAYAAKAVYLTERASGASIQPTVLELLKDVRSDKTNLRGDTVFSQTMMRAQTEKVS